MKPHVNTIANIYKDSTATLLLFKKKQENPHQKMCHTRRYNLSNTVRCMFRKKYLKELDWEEMGTKISIEHLSSFHFADDSAS